MADPITFRPTADDAKNLAALTADGTTPTHAIRHALEVAAREKRQADLRADAERLMAAPEYLAEVRAVREELDELRAW
jgi:DICT domain-containing protein